MPSSSAIKSSSAITRTGMGTVTQSIYLQIVLYSIVYIISRY